MTIAERKIKLVEKILNLDDDTVARVEEVLKNKTFDNSTIVVHNINGQEISLKEYRKKNKLAMKSYSEGKFMTSEELRKRFQNK